MWTLVSPLIDETSRGKFLFYGGNDYQGQGGLVDYISQEHIPDWLGGPKQTDIPEGGLVPKSYYMSLEEFEKDQSPGPHLLEDSIYNSTSRKLLFILIGFCFYIHFPTVSKGQVHEGVIRITDKGSVITWDFDVMRHDVVFTVYRLKQSLKAKSPSSTLTPTPTGMSSFPKKNSSDSSTTESKGSKKSDSGTVAAPASSADGKHKKSEGTEGKKETSTSSATGPGTTNANESVNEHKSIIDKSWREGVDYFKVESSIVCHDGESIQGSHVTSHEGIYILQWKFYDKLAHTHLSPLDTLTAAAATHVHKAKVMYYYETLNSADYKGSMTSLQSCQR